MKRLKLIVACVLLCFSGCYSAAYNNWQQAPKFLEFDKVSIIAAEDGQTDKDAPIGVVMSRHHNMNGTFTYWVQFRDGRRGTYLEKNMVLVERFDWE